MAIAACENWSLAASPNNCWELPSCLSSWLASAPLTGSRGPMRSRHREIHQVRRIGWLRAAVLGANDGIVSTASLIVGVAAAAAPRSDIVLAGVAGLVA